MRLTRALALDIVLSFTAECMVENLALGLPAPCTTSSASGWPGGAVNSGGGC